MRLTFRMHPVNRMTSSLSLLVFFGLLLLSDLTFEAASAQNTRHSHELPTQHSDSVFEAKRTWLSADVLALGNSSEELSERKDRNFDEV